jgi:hypothetical protein
MITVTFTADSIDQLREQMLQLLNAPYEGALPAPEFIPTRPKAGRKKVGVVPLVVPTEDEPAPEEVRASPEYEKPERWDSPPEGEEKVNVNGAAPPEPSTSTFDTKALLELKELVINELNARYRKGKVDEVKSFLDQYGKGAKSFRQIDINDFPAMDAAIRAGALGE